MYGFAPKTSYLRSTLFTPSEKEALLTLKPAPRVTSRGASPAVVCTAGGGTYRDRRPGREATATFGSTRRVLFTKITPREGVPF